MKNLRLTVQKGFSQIFLLVSMVILAIALPVTTDLVKEVQENRSKADGSFLVTDGSRPCCEGNISRCDVGTEGLEKRCSKYAPTDNNGDLYIEVPGGLTCPTTIVDAKCWYGRIASSCCGTANGGSLTVDFITNAGANEAKLCKLGATRGTLAEREGKLYWTCKDTDSTSCRTETCTVKKITSTTAATGITLNDKTVTLAIGESKLITVATLPKPSPIGWASNNDAVVTVNGNGLIKALKVGTAIITAGTTSGGTATVIVTVKTTTSTSACSSSGGKCVADSATCIYSELGKVVSDNKSCDTLSNVCCKDIPNVSFCETLPDRIGQGGTCVAEGACGGATLRGKGCTSTKPVCCKNDPIYEYKCLGIKENILKKCIVGSVTNCDTVDTCTDDEVCSAILQKCVDETTCKDGNTAVLVGDMRCINNRMKKCLASGSFDLGTICPMNQGCNSAGTGCVSITKKSSSGGSGSSGEETTLNLIPSTLALKVGQTGLVTPFISPSTSTIQTFTWSSSNPAVAIAYIPKCSENLVSKCTSMTDTFSVEGIGTSLCSKCAGNENEGLVQARGVGTAVVSVNATPSNVGTTMMITVTAADLVVTPTNENTQISFKFAFAGIKPGAACIGSLDDLTVEVTNIPTNVSQSLTTSFAKADDEQTDSDGNQIFQVSNLTLDPVNFGAVNSFNYVKVKGPFHLKRRMCLDGQSSKISENTVCDISLVRTDGYVYDFSEYTLLAGDIDLDGKISGIDHSIVKNLLNPAADVECGRKGDLNMDGVVNWLDGNLISDALLERDDE